MLHHYYFEIGGSLLLVVSAVIKVVLWRINVRHAVFSTAVYEHSEIIYNRFARGNC